jgi:hypothetical protein
MLGGARLLSAVEDHDGGHQLVRVRIWPVFAWAALVGVVATAGLALAAALNGSVIAAIGLGLLGLGLALRIAYESSVGVGVASWSVDGRGKGAG